jgi:hypothetical protein
MDNITIDAVALAETLNHLIVDQFKALTDIGVILNTPEVVGQPWSS